MKRPALLGLLLFLAVPVMAQPPSVTPPNVDLHFDYYGGGANNGFATPYVAGPVQGLPLIAGTSANVMFDSSRLIFPAGCSDVSSLTNVWLLIKDPASGTVQETPMQIVPGWSVMETIVVPSQPTLLVGFRGQTAGGCTARDTNYERFYQIPIDTGWSDPSVVSFDASTQVPTPSSPLVAGDYLVVNYDPARANGSFGTDGNGNPITLANVHYQHDGGDLFYLFGKVQFLDANGNKIGAPQSQPAVSGTTASTGYFKIPPNATNASVWFEAETFNVDTESEQGGAWDSNGGKNFVFAVQPPTAPSATGGLLGGLPTP